MRMVNFLFLKKLKYIFNKKNFFEVEEEKIVVKNVQDLCDINQTFQDMDNINDDLIADMLDDLHNNTDMENSVLQDGNDYLLIFFVKFESKKNILPIPQK